MLPEDDPKLIKLMIDYLYQLDYEIKPESCNGVITNGEPEIPPIPEADAPVAPVIERFEDMAAPPLIAEEELRELTKPKKTKSSRKKRSAASYDGLSVLRYQQAWIEESDSNSSKNSELNVHAQMYALADKYGIHDLKDLAREKFAAVASNEWDGKGFPVAVNTVYATTPESDYGLRNVVVDTLSEHRELLNKPEMEALVKEVNGLAFGLLKAAWGLYEHALSEF
ncbi:hypothetical protein EPUS_06449 [Endocarpon pusillum Z07020]|uniref:BTB domain-containing protein n=1 Tax=Endocarpon pusillum (strain Z07020 / HMAS-L-300199) TaxID=1263415 RepID=U1I4X4_ENDPU|nr:uncharacterized protein EPUS_06449 [Endocarpon pusillum Z07020]ERF77169.1 hypothetical protein EPUS_06449 [Endocarpon pusillum Z07020]